MLDTLSLLITCAFPSLAPKRQAAEPHPSHNRAMRDNLPAMKADMQNESCHITLLTILSSYACTRHAHHMASTTSSLSDSSSLRLGESMPTSGTSSKAFGGDRHFEPRAHARTRLGNSAHAGKPPSHDHNITLHTVRNAACFPNEQSESIETGHNVFYAGRVHTTAK